MGRSRQSSGDANGRRSPAARRSASDAAARRRASLMVSATLCSPIEEGDAMMPPLPNDRDPLPSAENRHRPRQLTGPKHLAQGESATWSELIPATTGPPTGHRAPVVASIANTAMVLVLASPT